MRDSFFLAIAVALLAYPATTHADDLEIRDLDVTGWRCLNQPAGTAKTQDGMERNPMKNRSPVNLSGMKIESLDTAGFLKKVAQYDAQINSQRRNQCTAAQKQILKGYENQIISLTGFLVLAYPGPPESTNCGDRNFHDWHLELFEKTGDHGPQIGDPTPIICEIAPRTERNIYRDGIRLQSLAGFFRRSKEYISTGHPPRLIRVTGYLTWDDEHNGTADVGPTIENVSPGNGFHHPWRSTAWEVHPVIRVEIIGANPSTDSAPSSAARQPTSAENGLSFITITQPVIVTIPYGEITLQPGQQVELVGRSAGKLRIKYLDRVYDIPAAAVQ